MASNQEDAVKRAARDAGKGSKTEQEAYDKYASAVLKSGGKPKSIEHIRGR